MSAPESRGCCLFYSVMHPKCLEPCLASTKYAEKIFLRFYLLIFRERGREGEREGEKHHLAREMSIACLSLAPPTDRGPNLQPRHVP